MLYIPTLSFPTLTGEFGEPATIWFKLFNERDCVDGVTLARLLNEIDPIDGRGGGASERMILTPEFFIKSFKLLRLIYISTEIILIGVVEFFWDHIQTEDEGSVRV